MVNRAASWARRRAGAVVVRSLFQGLSRVAALHPKARPHRHGVTRIRDIPYIDSGLLEHRLDVYHPTDQPKSGLMPTVFYVHGGAFQILSKDTHWVMGLAFARKGYAVFNISYRLAPQHRFPAGLEDCARALLWVKENAERYGADPNHIIFAGESAGANLATSLAIMTSYRRSEEFARAVYDAEISPRAVLAACGVLQVSDPDRYVRRKPNLPAHVLDRLVEVTDAYLPKPMMLTPERLDLADPVVLFERGDVPDRPLPPFFAPVGTRDPLLDDSRRLGVALAAMGVECETKYYPGQLHAFHALVFREQARQCWRDTFAFLDRVAPRG